MKNKIKKIRKKIMTKTKGGCKTPPYFISTYVKCFISGQIPYSSKSSIILFYRIRTFYKNHAFSLVTFKPLPSSLDTKSRWFNGTSSSVFTSAPVPEVMSERPPPSPPIARALPPLNINSALAPAISTCPFVNSKASNLPYFQSLQAFFGFFKLFAISETLNSHSLKKPKYRLPKQIQL